MKHFSCQLYYQKLHLTQLCNLAKYWLQAPWGRHETCRSVIICEIIVHVLVIVQNKEKEISLIKAHCWTLHCVCRWSGSFRLWRNHMSFDAITAISVKNNEVWDRLHVVKQKFTYVTHPETAVIKCLRNYGNPLHDPWLGLSTSAHFRRQDSFVFWNMLPRILVEVYFRYTAKELVSFGWMMTRLWLRSLTYFETLYSLFVMTSPCCLHCRTSICRSSAWYFWRIPNAVSIYSYFSFVLSFIVFTVTICEYRGGNVT